MHSVIIIPLSVSAPIPKITLPTSIKIKQFQDDQTAVKEEPTAVVHAPKTTNVPKMSELNLNPILSPMIPLFIFVLKKGFV